MLKKFIKKYLQLPESSWLENKDASENYKLHRDVVSRKPLLREVYNFWFNELTNPLLPTKGKKIMEIGAGGWNLSQFCDDVIISDIVKNEFCDTKVDAQNMPFKNSELDGIVLVDVLHHVPTPEQFFSEASRVLKIGGRVVMVEPYISPFSRFVFSKIHHEPFDDTITDWNLASQSGGRLAGANSATPHVIFVRDRKKFEKKFPNLKIEKISPHTCFSYLLSGGVTYRCLMPTFLTKPIMGFEKSIKFLRPLLATQMTIVLRKHKTF